MERKRKGRKGCRRKGNGRKKESSRGGGNNGRGGGSGKKGKNGGSSWLGLKVYKGCPKKHGNSVTNSISFLL